jgi:ligand-binding sensor domain-containing protein
MNIISDYLKLNITKISCVLTRNFLARIVVIIIFNIGIAGNSYGQTLQFRHYSTDEGFTGAAFKKIVQDSLGFLWIASGSGLYKFDGYTFTNYRALPNDSLSLPQEIVLRMWVDPIGRVWTGFPDRISFYDRDLDGFRSFRVPLGGANPESIFFENDKVVWLGTAGDGLVRFDMSTGSIKLFVNKSGVTSSAFANRNTILEIKENGESFLLGTAQGLWVMDKNTREFSRPPCSVTDSTMLYNDRIKKVFSGGNYIWLWTDKRLVQVTNTFSLIHSLDFNIIKQKFDKAGTFGGEEIKSITRDNNGLFWIATQGLGLVRYNSKLNELATFRNDRNDANSLPSDVLEDVMIDRNKNIWIATLPKGIAQIRNRGLEFINYLPGIPTTRLAIIPTKKGDQLVVLSNGDGIFTCAMDSMNVKSLSFKPFEPASDVKGFKSIATAHQSERHLWIGSIASGVMGLPISNESGIERGPVKLIQHDTHNVYSIPSNNLISPAGEDAEGNFFLGSRNDGLIKLVSFIEYGKEGSVIQYRHNDNDSTSLSNNFINGAFFDTDNSLLVPTQSGLDLFRDGKFEHILKDIPCTRILRHSDGTLLIGTKSGIYEGTKKG